MDEYVILKVHRCVPYLVLLYIQFIAGIEYTVRLSILSGRTENPLYINVAGSHGSLTQITTTSPLKDKTVYTFRVNGTDIGQICSVKLGLGGTDGVSINTVTAWKSENMHQTKVEFIFKRELDDKRVLNATASVPINGNWTQWTKWPPCLSTCQQNITIYRFRYCTNPTPSCGGTYCNGEHVDSYICEGLTTKNVVLVRQQHVVVIGMILLLCIVLCISLEVVLYLFISTNVYFVNKTNIGTICSVRLRLNGTDGWFPGTVNITVNTTNSLTKIFDFNQWLDDHTNYSLDVTKTNKINGNWSEWTKWPSCISPCQKNITIHRYRFCTNPRPGCGGNFCSGDHIDAYICNTGCSNTPNVVSIHKQQVVDIGIVLFISIILCVMLEILVLLLIRSL